MNRDDLIKFNIYKKWVKARIKFLEDQIETVGRITSVLSDMPKGSRQVYDTEAESLSTLLDKIQEVKKEEEEKIIKKETEIQDKLQLLEPKHGLLLYHFYILGDSIKYIAKEILHYKEKYVYDLKTEALEEFDKIGGEHEEFKNIYK